MDGVVVSDSKAVRLRILEELDELDRSAPNSTATWPAEDSAEHESRVRETEYLIAHGYVTGGVGGDHWVWGRITPFGRDHLETLRNTPMSTALKFTIAAPAELPPEWKELVRGIAIQHDFNAEPHLTSEGILVVLTTHAMGDEVRAEAQRVAAEIENALAQPSRVRSNAGSNVFINHGQAGAIGPNASASGNTFQQQVNVVRPLDGEEQRRIVEQLSMLVAELKARAEQPGEYAALADVAQAQLEAKNGDRSGVGKSLKRAGKWVFEVAEKIGVDVVVELIKGAM